jgi:hypothetical protein
MMHELYLMRLCKFLLVATSLLGFWGSGCCGLFVVYERPFNNLNCVSLVKSSALGPSIFSSHFFLYKLAVMNVNRHKPCINTFYSSCHRAIERER